MKLSTTTVPKIDDVKNIKSGHFFSDTDGDIYLRTIENDEDYLAVTVFGNKDYSPTLGSFWGTAINNFGPFTDLGPAEF